MSNSTETNQSLISIEVDSIVETENKIFNGMEYEGIIHTPKLDIFVKVFNSLDVLRDYSYNVGDYVMADVMVPDARYFRDIAPYKDNLEMTVISYFKNKDGEKELERQNRYKMVVTNQDNTSTNQLTNQSKEEMGTSGFRRLTCQLLDRDLEALRTVTISNIYKNCTVKDVILVELGNSKKYGIQVEGTDVSTKVTMVEPDNKIKYEHIVVGAVDGEGSRIKLLDLPSYLQNTNYGVYNGNIGTYLQKYEDKPFIFISPLYNSLLFDKAYKKLHIIKAPNMTYNEQGSTFKIDGDVISILVRSDAKSLDTGENEMISDGAAYTFTDPMMVISRDVIVDNGKITSNGSTHTKTISMKNRRDKNDNNNYIGSPVNIYKHRSNYIKSTFAIFQLQWNYCDMDIIYPYMPVCFMHTDSKNGIIKQYGIVQSTYYRYNNETGVRSGIINIAVEKLLFKDNLEGDDHKEEILDF